MPSTPERNETRLPDEPGIEATCRHDFEIHGHFWLPGTPAAMVAGVIHHSGGRIRLTLLGYLGAPPKDLTPHLFAPEAVLGQSYKGTLVTLFGCRQSFSQWSPLHDKGQSQLDVSMLLVGAHCGDEADLHFHAITGSFSNLEEWVGHIPFKPDYQRAEAGNKFAGCVTEYAPLQMISFAVPAIGAEVTLSSRFSAGGGSPFHQWHGRHIATLSITPSQPERLGVLLSRLHDIGNLFSLLIGENATPLRAALSGDLLPIAGCSSRAEYNLFITGRFPARDTTLHPHEILLGYRKLQPLFPEIVQSWFSGKDLLEPSASLLLGILETPHMFLDFRFLALVQATEALCRRCCPGTYMPKEAYDDVYETLCNAIPAHVPSELKVSLETGTLKYGNEYSLRKRLKDLLRSLEPETVELVTDKASTFADRIVNTRNYFTHALVDSPPPSSSGSELLWAFYRLRALLTIVLWKHLGIPESMARDSLLSGSGSLARIVQRRYATCDS